jgi:tellurite resistance protein TerC
VIAAAVRAAPKTIGSPVLWVGFLVAVLLLLAFDLSVTSRRGKTERFREALAWSGFWVALSFLFGLWIWIAHGREQGLQFVAGYLLEESLSVDNLFVFVLLFQSFAIPARFQHRVLFWGVLGALILRGSLILAGVALVHRFHWIIAIFGALLVYTGAKIAFHGADEEESAPTDNAVVRLARRTLPMTGTIEGPEFFVQREGRRFATPLLLAVVAAETTDLIFALDSIPAVFAVSDDSFIVFSSNICALLGLRALYFVVREVLLRLRYLKQGLAGILLFVGLKMLLYKWVSLPTGISLAIIAGILCVALLVSWFAPK